MEQEKQNREMLSPAGSVNHSSGRYHQNLGQASEGNPPVSRELYHLLTGVGEGYLLPTKQELNPGSKSQEKADDKEQEAVCGDLNVNFEAPANNDKEISPQDQMPSVKPGKPESLLDYAIEQSPELPALAKEEMAAKLIYLLMKASSTFTFEHSSRVIDLSAVVRHHNEKWDGKGYPDGLARKQIPLEARIVGLTDAYDTMVSDRPYRKGMPVQDAVAELKRCAGTHFDPYLVDAFIRMVERDTDMQQEKASPKQIKSRNESTLSQNQFIFHSGMSTVSESMGEPVRH